jgi:hypothetical protein
MPPVSVNVDHDCFKTFFFHSPGLSRSTTNELLDRVSLFFCRIYDVLVQSFKAVAESEYIFARSPYIVYLANLLLRWYFFQDPGYSVTRVNPHRSRFDLIMWGLSQSAYLISSNHLSSLSSFR